MELTLVGGTLRYTAPLCQLNCSTGGGSHTHTHHCSATVRGVSQGPIFTGLDSSTTYFPAVASYGSSTKPVVKVC